MCFKNWFNIYICIFSYLNLYNDELDYFIRESIKSNTWYTYGLVTGLESPGGKQ